MSHRFHVPAVSTLLGLVAVFAALSITLSDSTQLAAAANESCPKTTLTDIEDEVMCPVCGTPLVLAEEAPQAKRERAFIVDLIKQCRSKEQIKKSLVAEFGTEILALPEKRGFDLAAWVVPILALLFAAIGIALALIFWRRRSNGAEPPATAPPLSKSDTDRLDDEISRLDP